MVIVVKQYAVYLVAGGLILLSLASCQRDPDDRGVEYAPNMYRSVPYDALKQHDKNPYNPQGMSMRLPVAGTVTRKINMNSNAGGAANDLMIYRLHKDSIGLAERVLKNPIPRNDTTLAEGKILYGNICQPCHGVNGRGDGTVGKVYKGVPSYSAGAYKEMNDGHIFHVITHGKGRMWPHGSQLTPEERWRVVHYVHELQQLD